MDSYTIRESTRDDCDEIIRLIKKLAEHMKLAHKVTLTADQLREDGFGSAPLFRCLVAEQCSNEQSSSGDRRGNRLVAYALFFYHYSTFEGKSMYNEDIYVSPDARGRGVASELLKRLAMVASETHCRRMDLVVQSWNKTRDWVERLGAVDMTTTEKWHLHRFYGDQIHRIATATTVARQQPQSQL